MASAPHVIRRGLSGVGPWPWAPPATPPLPETLPDGAPWPKISILVHQIEPADPLERTLLSVIHQQYPAVELILVGPRGGEVPAGMPTASGVEMFFLSADPAAPLGDVLELGFVNSDSHWL